LDTLYFEFDWFLSHHTRHLCNQSSGFEHSKQQQQQQQQQQQRQRQQQQQQQ
jgi:hypothetical protein